MRVPLRQRLRRPGVARLVPRRPLCARLPGAARRVRDDDESGRRLHHSQFPLVDNHRWDSESGSG